MSHHCSIILPLKQPDAPQICPLNKQMPRSLCSISHPNPELLKNVTLYFSSGILRPETNSLRTTSERLQAKATK